MRGQIGTQEPIGLRRVRARHEAYRFEAGHETD